MHQLITILVQAHTKDEALSSAQSALDTLVGIGFDNAPIFDYYHTFDERDARFKRTVAKAIGAIDEDSTNTESVEVPAVFSLNTPEGEALLDHMQSVQQGKFEEAFETVKEKLEELTVGEVMNDVDGARYHLSKLTEYQGPSVSIYDEFGSGLLAPRKVADYTDRLQKSSVASDGGTPVATSTPSEDDQPLRGWIVPADVHY